MTRWLGDLIWIGNTLYPRWFVIGVVLLFVIVVLLLGRLSWYFITLSKG